MSIPELISGARANATEVLGVITRKIVSFQSYPKAVRLSQLR